MNNETLSCPFCGKECKNKNSLTQHSIRCKENTNRIPSNFSKYNKEREGPWNKGLSGDPRCKHSEESKQKIKKQAKERNAKVMQNPNYSEYRLRMRELALKRELGGFNFRRGVTYNNIKLDSSYEIKVAESLDKNNIRWQRCSRFKYIDNNGKLHHYTPDFYLPDYDVYLDPKNDYLINNIKKGWEFSDKTKIDWVMEQNNIVILILDKNNLSWDKIKDKIYQEIKIN